MTRSSSTPTADRPIAVDLRPAAGRPTGVGRYALMLAQAYAEAHGPASVRGYIDQPGASIALRAPLVPLRPGAAWHVATLRHAHAHPVRAYVSTSLIVPAIGTLPVLPVIHDLTTFTIPSAHRFRTRLFERLLLPYVARRRVVITSSRTTANDLGRRFGPAVRTVVVPPWVDVTEHPLARTPIDAGGADILLVGTIEPRKNIQVALKAVRELRRRGRLARLVVVGGPGWHAREDLAALEAAVEDGIAERRGYLDDEQRDRLYAAAALLVIPSFAEGFGLPLLEAFARGLPVVSSTAAALLEVSGGAALHVDPDDVTGWVEAIESLLTAADRREALSAAGRQRARDFTRQATVVALDHALGALEGG